MIIILSPSKTLDFSGEFKGNFSQHDFMAQSLELIKNLRKLSVVEICKLMDISEKLGELNYRRYKDFHAPFFAGSSCPAIYAFKGDVYDGLKVEDFHANDVEYAQQHLRIISGLYGLLRPMDLILPYRLEMGIALENKSGKNLYQFWGDKITNSLNDLLQTNESKILVNLASVEYFKVVNNKLLEAEIVTPLFKEKKGDSYKMIALFAKRARGSMAAYMIKNRVKTINDLKKFNEDGYVFSKALSEGNELVFVRG